MIELVAAIALAVVVWHLRSSFFTEAASFKEDLDLNAEERKADRQDRYKEVLDKIEEVKSKNDGKWYSMNDIHAAMKSNAD